MLLFLLLIFIGSDPLRSRRHGYDALRSDDAILGNESIRDCD